MLVYVRDFWYQRVFWVGVSKKRTDGKQYFADRQRWAPLVLEDVQADGAVGVDVGVVDSRDEVELGRLEGVVRRELDIEGKDASLERTVLRAHDGSQPVEEVPIVARSG